ncbi:hypothetical protein Y032_0320g2378 [Ancylostoma ceylanicum]|uniref:Uncharacterized protein n=1 Tax=Ancylostoma ceylanicum TaxID=53326 RepID=A0A016S0T0_9BILA|nr:hypothetical protein Y032_0320g2378 [Ancylostoma ceylanicum]
MLRRKRRRCCSLVSCLSGSSTMKSSGSSTMKSLAFTALLLILANVDYCKGVPTMNGNAYHGPERLVGIHGENDQRVRRDQCCRVSQILNCCTFQWYWKDMPM